ncbi:hypothetical protein E4U42_000078 [Claviceps africana]|uniref:Uncharacterized protein n=1 Tax=Claviceps africana TaxID=83212 RepID=A0A8K0JBS4_9HYPO|nr:hypothetical protein E4U42_000078 [Claviceps africana]
MLFRSILLTIGFAAPALADGLPTDPPQGAAGSDYGWQWCDPKPMSINIKCGDGRKIHCCSGRRTPDFTKAMWTIDIENDPVTGLTSCQDANELSHGYILCAVEA